MVHLSSRVGVVVGDITGLDVDAVVTAANSPLMGGGGVDGAVHAAAGPKLVAASRRLAPCPAGQARITDGYNLHAKHVIHAVGPIYQDGESGEDEALQSAYRSSLTLAAENRVRTIAFPCISTGVYGYPRTSACRIAIDTVIDWLQEHELPQAVTFCCYDSGNEQLYVERLTKLGLIAGTS